MLVLVLVLAAAEELKEVVTAELPLPVQLPAANGEHRMLLFAPSYHADFMALAERDLRPWTLSTIVRRWKGHPRLS